MKKFISHIAFAWLPAIGFTQTEPDTVLPKNSANNLAPIEVVYFNHITGIKQTKIDSASLIFNHGKSLADVLRSSGCVYIKQYAPGQLSTISMRGSNASQVQVLWKGFNLNNLSVGLTDFSLVPTTLFNNIIVNMGSVGATGGNGVVAGGIELQNTSPLSFDNNLVVEGGFNTGSFGRYSGNLSFSKQFKKTEFTFSPFYSSIKNNFSFLTSEGNSSTMKHASSINYGGIANFKFQTQKHYFSIDTWNQVSHREIPSTIVEPVSTQTQDDKSYKVTLNHVRINKNLFSENRMAWFYDELVYKQSPILTSGYKTNNFIGETVSKWNKKNSQHSISLNGSVAFSENTGYSTGIKQMIRTSVGYFFETALGKIDKTTRFSFALKEEWNSNHFSIPIVQTGLQGKIYHNHKLLKAYFLDYKLNGGTVYRFPTLNDRFWSPGGNPLLKPEKGFNGNGTISFSLRKNNRKAMNIEKHKTLVKIDFTHFERYVYDWIMWQPRNGYWTPQNLLAVWSRGNETEIYFEFGRKLRFYSKSLFNYTRSSQTKSNLENDNSIGQQLIYTPMYNYTSEAGLKFKNMVLSWAHSYYGYRYTSSDNYEYLKPFNLDAIKFLWQVRSKTATINMYAEVDNLFNVNYYWVAQRPTLPRNFNLGLIVKLTKQ